MGEQEARSCVNPDHDQYFVQCSSSSNQCGQAVVAMISETNLDYAIRHIGKKGLTRIEDLANFLQVEGYEVGLTQRIPPKFHMSKLPSLAIVKMYWVSDKGRDRQHWLLWRHNQLICPNHGIIDPALYEALLQGRNLHNPWLTSYAEVFVANH